MKATPAPSSALSYMAIGVLALLSAVAPLATDMYLPGFPAMSADLGASATQIQMTLTSFLLGLAGGQLIIGPLSDRFGRRLPLLVGTGLCVISGFLCAFVSDVGTLIVLRALQGIGGAAGVVLARAVVADTSRDAATSARLFQIMMMIGSLAPVLAPMAGTGVVLLGGWRAVFIVTTALSVLSLIGVIRTVPETLPPERRILGGAGALARSLRQMLGNRRYLGFALTTSFVFMMLFSYIAASPFVYQEILGLSPAAYAGAFGLNAIGMTVLSAVSARLVSRISPLCLAGIGLALACAGAMLLLVCTLAGAGAALMLPCIFVAVLPFGLILGNVSALAIAEAPRSAGTASAALGALQFCLGAIASPLAGLGGKHDAVPMALTMSGAALCAVVSFVCLAGALRRPCA
ncbi:MAG TPA: multidrug effflux MFS transporter [Paenirhodobacter sp.]